MPVLWVALLIMSGCAHPPSSSRIAHSRQDRQSLPPLKAVQVDLDYVFDTDKKQQQANLDLLTERVAALGVNTVFLQAFADADGDDVAESLYFNNQVLPVREDLFGVAADALRNTGVSVYAWLPLLAYRVPDAAELSVRSSRCLSGHCKDYPHRLSPFNKKARRLITSIYNDLAKQTRIDGILFHDDGVLGDYEDNSASARLQYRNAGFPDDIPTIRKNPVLMAQWSQYKTRYLVDFSLSLLAVVKQYQPGVRSARNLFAKAVLEPRSEMWFGQSLKQFMASYDYTALMAMPYLEQASSPDTWMEQLGWAALACVDTPNRLVFELQSRDWRTRKSIAGQTLAAHIRQLAASGAQSFAYYPDDFYNNIPPAALIRACLHSPVDCQGEERQ